MRLRTATATTLAALALALGVSACGNDGDGATPAASTSTPATTATPTTAATDSTNPTPRPTSGTVVVAALGDSITAGSPLYDPDPAIRDQIGEGALNPMSQWEYWYREANPRYRFKNCGIFGQRTDEIAQRLDDCAEGAQVLVVQGGINDIAQGRDVADAADDITTMIRQGKERGLRVATVEVLPWNNGYPDADPRIRELNGLIRRTAKAERVPVFAWYAALEDPKAPGRMRQNLTDDGNHPSVAGYRKLAAAVRLP